MEEMEEIQLSEEDVQELIELANSLDDNTQEASEEDIELRHLYISGEINETISDSICYYIMKYNRDDVGIAVEDRTPIIIYIDSVGGNVPHGFGIIGAIKASKTPVYTVNTAVAYSMSFLIFLAGEKRYAMPYTQFLMHDGQCVYTDNVGKIKDMLIFETDQIESLVKNYVIDKTDISEEVYEQNYRREWYFLPEEGKKIGAVDFIVGVDCDIEEVC